MNHNDILANANGLERQTLKAFYDLRDTLYDILNNDLADVETREYADDRVESLNQQIAELVSQIRNRSFRKSQR